MRQLNKTVIVAAALLFTAAHANATSGPVIRVECHETRVDTVTTNNVVSSNHKTDNVVVYEINEAFGMMYPVVYNGTPVYNGQVTYVKTSPLAVVLDDDVERHSAYADYKMTLNRVTGDLSRISSHLVDGNGMSSTTTGHCEPVTLTPKF